MEEDLVASDSEAKLYLKTSKKRKVLGRMSDARKKLLASSHETGPDCKCARYLAGLVVVVPVARRRLRQPEEFAVMNHCSYPYRVRVKKGFTIEEIPVCFKAFASLYGITKKKVEIIQKYL